MKSSEPARDGNPSRGGLSRRKLLFAAALSPALGQARAAPNGATLLVAGPEGGSTAAWADILTPALVKSLPSGLVLARENVGAADGVTGANQFQARTAFDGGTVLLLPGQAALAWLIGDPRAQFDAARWVTALAAVTPTVIASRTSLEQIMRNGSVRVAGAPDTGGLAALLTFDLIGTTPLPVLSTAPDYSNAESILLSGRAMPEQLTAAARFGFRPILNLGDPAGSTPDGLPTAQHLVRADASPGLLAAWRATVAATRLDTALVLPQLTPPSMVAIWRRAGAQAADTTVVQAAEARLGIQAEAGADAVASTAPIAADAGALLDLRAWLLQRFGWRPHSG